MRFDNLGHCVFLTLRLLHSWSYIVNILLKDRSNNQRQWSEGKVVERNIDIVEDSLRWKTTVEGKDKLGKGEEHVFVEEVKNHLSNAYVVPPAMD